MGCDGGSILCLRAVDAQMVADLLRFVALGGPSNGVGVTQLTYAPLIREADAMGGAHLVRYQMRRGFSLLSDYSVRGGVRWGLAAYNGGPGNPQYAYADAVLAKRDDWRARLS